MSLNVGPIHIERLYLGPGAAGLVEDELAAAREAAAAPPAGPPPPEAEVAPAPSAPPAGESQTAAETAIADRYTTAEVNVTARANLLRNVVHHVDRARRLEGFQTNHQRRPRVPRQVNARQHAEYAMAKESLERACGVCALRNNCRITNDIDGWLDMHPYKDGPGGQRRPGSIPRGESESRTQFLRALKQDPLAHCEPAKRK